ncbi:TIGR01777 family oxidoreductase [Paenibacillus sp. 481]|uniref:TIGR01777 family oxidoreductase n=1 Tax=Paenibacillus sp. 481 TaxID=2835869 RepID=UPI001E4DEC33|nr:TIGR01777 family oxidoreductase [Paenibacillus sp. 481]
MICGGTGLVGKALSRTWLQQGHDIIVVSRSGSKLSAEDTHPRLTTVRWSELTRRTDEYTDIDVVVNLAGESISQRWTDIAKNRIMSSRILPAKRLAEWANSINRPVPLYISASGISVYGPSTTGTFDETSLPIGDDFLSDVVHKWEAVAHAVPATRRVILRLAPVLANEGGAFPRMRLPYKLGVGGRLGNGEQPFSWIHIQDLISLIDFIVQDHTIEGIVNASAPEAVTNDTFGRTISKVYNRPHWMPVPAFVFHILFGEMSTLLLHGQRVYPAKMLEHGFTFHYGTVERALHALKEDELNTNM